MSHKARHKLTGLRHHLARTSIPNVDPGTSQVYVVVTNDKVPDTVGGSRPFDPHISDTFYRETSSDFDPDAPGYYEGQNGVMNSYAQPESNVIRIGYATGDSSTNPNSLPGYRSVITWDVDNWLQARGYPSILGATIVSARMQLQYIHRQGYPAGGGIYEKPAMNIDVRHCIREPASGSTGYGAMNYVDWWDYGGETNTPWGTSGGDTGASYDPCTQLFPGFAKWNGTDPHGDHGGIGDNANNPTGRICQWDITQALTHAAGTKASPGTGKVSVLLSTVQEMIDDYDGDGEGGDTIDVEPNLPFKSGLSDQKGFGANNYETAAAGGSDPFYTSWIDFTSIRDRTAGIKYGLLPEEHRGPTIVLKYRPTPT